MIAEGFAYPSAEVQRMNAEAEIARVEGYLDKAIGTFEKYLEYSQKGGKVWAQARRLIDLGDCLMSRDSPGDRERARMAYKQSL